MLTPEDRKVISNLSSGNMEQFSRRLLTLAGINRHYAAHLQIQEILSLDPSAVKTVFDNFSRSLEEQSREER